MNTVKHWKHQKLWRLSTVCLSDLFLSLLRPSVHPPSGGETGDSWHGCWPVGWEQTNSGKRGVQHAGGVSWSRERVSPMIFFKNYQLTLSVNPYEIPGKALLTIVRAII